MTGSGKREEQADLRDDVQEVDLAAYSQLTAGDVGEEGVKAVFQVSSWDSREGEEVCAGGGNHRLNIGHTKWGCYVAFDLQCFIGNQICQRWEGEENLEVLSLWVNESFMENQIVKLEGDRIWRGVLSKWEVRNSILNSQE